MKQPTLAYVETSLPDATQAKRFAAVRRWGIALEIANFGDIQIDVYKRAQIPIASVQAYQMHDFHPLHCNAEHRHQAKIHVEQTLELAAQLNAPRIVTVCGFGHDLADNPLERAVEFFSSLAQRAAKLGVRIMIEPLSPKRAGALTHPDEIVSLIRCLNQPEVFSLVLDTGHLLDSGFDLNLFFSIWQHPVEEMQLKGINSAPPTLTMPLASWIKVMKSPPDVICVEHRQAISWTEFDQIIQKCFDSLGNLNKNI
ncbi:MAG: sugar phosphate isomerase/epimerase [Mojavia pulchra JT2-VF2]|jgi:sugar phosphate isomerase/epimerase|uniref:Sugar phosphate isomerase/epimerase n=1 Tax=Mojavia pulchra JT2-VF2 TaxID=287848 RepID=A0A951UJF1_9NOST|nr:sugar phosphate isomerase/epimerase [Mojavia pulchra JT2-VF2]